LRIFRQSFVVQSSIERVWHFYTNVKHLEVITPKQIDLQIIKTTSENIVQGQEIWVSGKIFEAIKIRRKMTHKFHNIMDGRQTEIIDEVEFELPYGILGKLFEGYAYKQLQNIFEHRKIATVKALE
jgi:ligand-binding SRPBCC domain-containing protein